MRRKFWMAALAALMLPADAARADDRAVVMGQIDISFYAVAGVVVQDVLERLGHRVEVRTGSHGDIFPVLGRGELDLLVAAWLPSGHAEYWARYGGDAAQLATLYRGARLYWAVPPYVPADQVASVADLKKPDVARRMVKTIRVPRRTPAW
jgi:glycine betaine/proline transport system substrate-binding protein